MNSNPPRITKTMTWNSSATNIKDLVGSIERRSFEDGKEVGLYQCCGRFMLNNVNISKRGPFEPPVGLHHYLCKECGKIRYE